VKNSKPLITINSPYNTTENHENNKVNENLNNHDLYGNDEKHENKDINNKDDSHSHQKDLRYDTNNHIGDYIEVGKGVIYMYIYVYVYIYIYMYTYLYT
jgi:hypothetical protein